MAYKKYSRRKRKTKGRTRKMRGRSRKMRGGHIYRCWEGNNKDDCEQIGKSWIDTSQKCKYNNDNTCTAYVEMTKELAFQNINSYNDAIRVLNERFENKYKDPEYMKLVKSHGNEGDIRKHNEKMKILQDKLSEAVAIYEPFWRAQYE